MPIDDKNAFTLDLLQSMEAVDRARGAKLSPMQEYLVQKMRAEGMTDEEIEALMGN